MTKELIESGRKAAIECASRQADHYTGDTVNELCDALEQMQEQRDAFEGSFNAAIGRIEELEGDCEAWEKAAKNLQADNERLRGVYGAAKLVQKSARGWRPLAKAIAAVQESDDD